MGAGAVRWDAPNSVGSDGLGSVCFSASLLGYRIYRTVYRRVYVQYGWRDTVELADKRYCTGTGQREIFRDPEYVPQCT
ncbi:hypothetical protein D3C81_1769990 [compost metagenome]